MTKTIQQCNDDNPKIRKVTFDVGDSIVSDTILLCDKCFNRPPFDMYILKVVRLDQK